MSGFSSQPLPLDPATLRGSKSTPDAVFLRNSDGVLQAVNPEFARLAYRNGFGHLDRPVRVPEGDLPIPALSIRPVRSPRIHKKDRVPYSLVIEDVDCMALIPHPQNPREGDIGAIATSIQEHGWFGVLVVQRSTGYILAGNHRFQAARMLGKEKFPVHYVDVDDTQALKILLVDNRSSDLAAYSLDVLEGLLEELAPDLSGTGFDLDDLDHLDRLVTVPQDFEDREPSIRKCPHCGGEFTDGY